MSDESAIAASTLLSPLLGAVPVIPAEQLIQQPAGEALTGNANDSLNFRQLMQFNIDGDGASLAGYDGESPTAARLNGGWQLGEAAVNPTGIYPGHTQLAANEIVIDPHESGNILPPPGTSLPPDTSESNAETLLGDRLIFAESDTDHSLHSSDDSISASIDAIEALNESIAVANDTNSETQLTISKPPPQTRETPNDSTDVVTDPNPETQLAIGQPLQQTPIRPISLEQSSVRSRELSEASLGASTTAEVLDANGEVTLEGNTELGQDDNPPDQSAENPFDNRTQRGITAEFAVDDNLANNSPSRTGESTLGVLPTLGQATGSSPLVASSSLTVAGDRQIAGQQIAQHVASFVRQGDEFAEINLTPPHLGKISARITLENDQATVVLTAPSSEIREIMEASLPKLSSLLEEAGLTLADANVEGQAQNNADEEPTQRQANSDTAEIANEKPTTPLRETVRGLLDAYA